MTSIETTVAPAPPTVAPSRSTLVQDPRSEHVPTVAADPVAGHAALDPEPGIGRAFAIGAVVGFFVSFVLFGALGLLVGMEPGAALGMAVYAAAWGGPGFGGMTGAVLHWASREGW